RGTEFTFEPYPDLGVWVQEIFIKDDKVALDGNLKQYLAGGLASLLGVRIYGDGDGREHSPNFDPNAVRAFIVLDFEEGRGYIIAHNSQALVYFIGGPPPLPPVPESYLYTQTFTANE